MKSVRLDVLRKRARLFAAIAVASATALCLVGCGASNADDDEASSNAAATVSREEMQAGLDSLTTKPSSIGLTEALKAIPEGKKVGWIGGGTPNDEIAYDAFKEAADLLKMDATKIVSSSDAQEVVAGMEQARNQKYDLVILSGLFAGAIGPQLSELHESGVKTLGFALSIDEFQAPNIDFSYFPNTVQTKIGSTMADFLVLNSKDTAHILFPIIPDVASGVAQYTGFTNRIKETCPACTVEKLEFPFSQVGSALPGRIVSAIQANPKINAIYVPFGAVFTGVPEALKQSGLDKDVIAATASGVPLNMAQIESGQVLLGSMDSGLEYQGWMMADGAARMLAGQEIPTDVYNGFDFPWQIHTKDNLDFDITQPWAGAPDDFKAQFEKLWGVS